MERYFSAKWMKQNILQDRGPLLAMYKAHEDGRFRSEGDSPAFLHTIPNGLRSTESPDWGGWDGRYVKVRENTWLDPVTEPGYRYPTGRRYTGSAWGRTRLKKGIPNDAELTAYLKPQWRWIDAIQNDFVVIGGTSLSGGRGSVWGTVLGCLIIGVLNNGLVLLEVSPLWQQVIKGGVILAAVALDKAGSRND